MFLNAFKKIWAPVVNSDEDEAKEREELGITEELIQLVDNISRFPESFKDFPYQTLKDPSLKMSKLQKRHVQKILEIVKPLSDLRFQICPSVMNDEKFWTIYFTHIQVVSKGIFGTNVQQIPSSSSYSSKPVDILDELDSQFDKLSTKKKPFDEGISEEEDSYFSLNTFVLQSQLQAQQQAQAQTQQTTTSLKSSTSSLSSSTSSLSTTPNKSKNNLQIGTNRPVTVSASSPPQTTTTTNNTTTNTTNNILASPNNNNDKILNNTEPLNDNNNLDKNIDNFLNPS